MPTNILVSQYMSGRLVSVDSSASALDVANKMISGNVGAIVVSDSGRHIGILTERDLTRQVTAKDTLPSKTPATAIMSAPLIVVSRDLPVDAAAEIMIGKKIRHLAVTEEGRVIGMITTSDLLRYIRDMSLMQERISPSVLEALYSSEEPTEENLS